MIPLPPVETAADGTSRAELHPRSNAGNEVTKGSG